VPCSCAQKELATERLARLQRYSNLGALTRLTFDGLIPRGRSGAPANQKRFDRAWEVSKSFAQDPQGWLVLMGPPGCGKTHLAAAIANRCIADNRAVFFLIVPDFLDHLRSTFNPASDVSYDELFEQVREVPLLILDDLGAHSSTPWAQEKLFQLINHRYNSLMPTVVTMNISLEKLDDRLQARISDPALSQICVVEESASPVTEYFGNLGLELLSRMTFENFDPKRVNLPRDQQQNLGEAFRLAREFAESPEGWLVFQGTNGCGKTHLAAAIRDYRLQQGQQVFFVTVQDFLDHLRASFGPDSEVHYDELFERVKNAPLLILDDFGEQSSTPWAQAKLYQLINYRYVASLPTVVTSCMSLDEIETRISSRMADHRTNTVFNILAPDYRADRPTEKPSTGYRRRRSSGK
jgi:DNA replication protein DnaC